MKIAGLVQKVLYYILTALSWILTPLSNKIFSLIYDGKSRIVPPVEDDILCQSAVTLARKIRSREVRQQFRFFNLNCFLYYCQSVKHDITE